MKRPLHLPGLILAFVILFLNGCKKQSANNITSETAKQVSSWLDIQMSKANASGKDMIGTLKKNLDFNNLRFEGLNDKGRLAVIPISANFSIKSNSKSTYSLLVFLNSKEHISKSQIVQYQADGKIQPVVGTFTKIFNSKNVESDGKFAFYDL